MIIPVCLVPGSAINGTFMYHVPFLVPISMSHLWQKYNNVPFVAISGTQTDRINYLLKKFLLFLMLSLVVNKLVE